MAEQRYTPQQLIDTLRTTRGMVTLAARTLRCSRDTIYEYAHRYPEVQAALDDERAYTTDVAEIALFNAIQSGEAWAVQFYLRTQGKPRGYVDRLELSGPNGGPMQHEDVTRLTDAERAERLAALFDLVRARTGEPAAGSARALDAPEGAANAGLSEPG